MDTQTLSTSAVSKKENGSMKNETSVVGIETAKPAHGTGEWAKHNTNIQSGCRNRCAYCYASAMAIRFGRKTPGNWGVGEVNQAKVAMEYRRQAGRIMYPTSHDIDPGNIDACITVLGKILASGNEVLVVSKPRLSCVKRLCSELAAYKKQIVFRFTIGSADDTVLKAWEPEAPSFKERIACLRHAYHAGFATSVSCEPMLDDNIDAVIKAAKPFVTDSIWLGIANQLRQIVSINRPGNLKVWGMADRLIRLMSDEHIHGLYRRYRNDRQIKWKDSLKKRLGLERPSVKGLDV